MPQVFILDKIIRTPNNSMFCYMLDSNDLLWHHRYSDLLEGERVHQVGNILVHNNILYISLSDWEKGDGTFCININTGEIVKRLMTLGFIQKENGTVYSPYGYEIKTVNTNDFKTKIVEIEDLKKTNLFINKSRWIVKGNLLYFVDGDIMPTNRTGIIDLETNKLVWQTELQINGGINNEIREIRVQNNRLYAHCADNTLHIFEED
jgi:hypothetical protein